MNRVFVSRVFLILCVCCFLHACANKSLAPVEERGIGNNGDNASVSVDGVIVDGKPSASTNKSRVNTVDSNKDFHVVVAGDTLHAIAFRYAKDYKQIAAWNKISEPYTIYIGQVLRLSPQSVQKKPTVASKPAAKPPTPKPVPRKPATPPQKKTNTVKDDGFKKGPVSWQWPTTGKLVRSNSPSLKKGINISGKVGQQIKAAANGKVVYSGSGLLGYGKLIIIKHSDTYLSAYAYNSKLLVKEGDVVKLGQNISLMGQDNNDRPILHFEIRKNGKPTNPLDFLPKKRT